MEEVFINQEADPYVLEVDGRLDLSALDLQPASIVINSKKSLVDAQTSKTKRTFTDIQQKVLHDDTAGSKANPLIVSGTHVAGKPQNVGEQDLLQSIYDKLASLEASVAAKPASIVFSKMSGNATNKLLKGMGINEVDGFDLEPLELDDGLQDLEPFDYSHFPDEDTGTPDFVAYHAQQLRQCGVHLGPGGFRMHDLHKQTLYHIEVDGKRYSGGVDAGLIPHGIMPSSAGSMLRIGFEHKQSTMDKDQYRLQNNILQARSIPAKEYPFSEGRAQVVCCLIAAYAMCQFPLDLDLSDGKRHHLLRLRGDQLLEYLNCTPKQAYGAMAQTLIKQGDMAASTACLSEPPEQLDEVLARPFKKLKGLVQDCALLDQVQSIIAHSPSVEHQIQTAFEMAMGSEPPMLDCVRDFYGR